MSCDCYKIGGPWIAVDPDCPVHGRDAQRRQDLLDEERQSMEERMAALESRLEAIEAFLNI